jgi:hypothetical protein
MVAGRAVRVVGLLLAVCMLTAVRGVAQNTTAAGIRGTVTDQSGAVVPEVMITLENTLTGIIQTTRTNSTGTYDMPFVPPGSYSMKFSKEGFKQLVRDGIVLQVQIVTIDAQLQVGSTTQSVKVTAAAALVQTENAEQTQSLNSTAIIELPMVNRNLQDYLGLVVGGGSGFGGNENAEFMGVNGGRPFNINYTTNGGWSNTMNAYNLDIDQPNFEAVSEVSMVVGNMGAQYGNGNATFQIQTKSGTNKFHGTLFEWDQNDKFEARNFFAETGTKPPLRWNQVGGTIGGPIRRNKAFFFFSYEKFFNNSSGPYYTTVPTASMLEGDFSAPGLPAIYDPLTTCGYLGNPACATGPGGQPIVTRTQFTGNMILPGRIDTVGGNISKFFPAPNQPGIANNYYGVGAYDQNRTQYLGTVDINLTSSHRLGFTYFQSDQALNLLYDYPSGVCPAGEYCVPYTYVEPEAVLTETWTLGPNKVNEFRSSFVLARVNRPAGTAGEGFPGKLGMPNTGVSVFPFVRVTGGLPFYGVHEGTGGGFYDRDNTIMPASDTFTWVSGKHTIKFGGQFDKPQDDFYNPQAGSENLNFTGVFTTNLASPAGTGMGTADLLLGLVNSYQESISSDLGGRRWDFQPFVQDDFKLRPNLTLNFGLRYEVQSGESEAFHRQSNFDPNLTNVATGTRGAIAFTGQNSPDELQNTKYTLFSPRVGFAWSPGKDKKLAIRGGYGVYFTPMMGMFWNWSAPAGYDTFESGTVADEVTPLFTLEQGPPVPPVPCGYVHSCTNAILNGQAISSYYPYKMPAMYMQDAHLDFQHEFGDGFMLDVGYVHSKGTHLVFMRDINQVPEALLGPGNAQANRPYPQYQGIRAYLNDGDSDYDALQIVLNKRTTHGLQFNAHYTFSKMMDNSTISTVSGGEFFENSYAPRSLWGPSTNDGRHRFVASFVYELPFGSGKPFLNKGVQSVVLGNWEVSGVYQAFSGNPFTPTDSIDLSNSLSGTPLPNRIGNGNISNPTLDNWFNMNDFVEPAPYTFGNAGRDILWGPAYQRGDFGLMKNFPIKYLGEHGNLEFKADAFNIFNHPNFYAPSGVIGPGGATITGAYGSRNFQLGARLSF